MEYLWKALRPIERGCVEVVGFFEQKGGVLDGQTLTHFISSYASKEEALKAHPDCGDNYVNKYTAPVVSLAHLPDEDTPVAGGMYPDDWPL